MLIWNLAALNLMVLFLNGLTLAEWLILVFIINQQVGQQRTMQTVLGQKFLFIPTKKGNYLEQYKVGGVRHISLHKSLERKQGQLKVLIFRIMVLFGILIYS